MPVPVRLCRQLTVIARHAWARGLVEDGLEFAGPGILLRFTLPSYEHWEYCDPGGNWCEWGDTEKEHVLLNTPRRPITRKSNQGTLGVRSILSLSR